MQSGLFSGIRFDLVKQAGLRFSVQLGKTLTSSIKLNDEG